MSESTRQKVVRLALEFQKKTKENTRPTQLYLTKVDEEQLAGAEEDLGSLLYGQVQKQGLRLTLPTLFGMKIHWDAEETKVE